MLFTKNKRSETFLDSVKVFSGDGGFETYYQKKNGWQHNNLFLARLLGISLAMNMCLVLNHCFGFWDFSSIIQSVVIGGTLILIWDKW